MIFLVFRLQGAADTNLLSDMLSIPEWKSWDNGLAFSVVLE